MKAQSKKGFTLVEIMIVVVIIGLLAAMAIPAFQKVRENSIEKTLVNDGRQIGSAAQQYYMESGTNTVDLTVDTVNGTTSGKLTDWVSKVTKKTTFPTTIAHTRATPNAASFTLTHDIGTIVFTSEGKVLSGTGAFEGLEERN